MIKLHDNCVTPYVTIIIMQFIMAVFRETRFFINSRSQIDWIGRT